MTSIAVVPEFGPYSFNYVLTDQDRQKALGVAEMKLLRQGGPSFLGEEIVSGLPVRFEDQIWESVLGAVNGRVYKISLKTAESSETLRELKTRLSLAFDDRYRRAASPSRWIGIWDCGDGDIVLDQSDATVSSLVLTATSRKVRVFQVAHASVHSAGPLSYDNSRRIGAILMAAFWLLIFAMSVKYHWWIVIRIPIDLIAFFVTVFATKQLINSFVNR